MSHVIRWTLIWKVASYLTLLVVGQQDNWLTWALFPWSLSAGILTRSLTELISESKFRSTNTGEKSSWKSLALPPLRNTPVYETLRWFGATPFNFLYYNGSIKLPDVVSYLSSLLECGLRKQGFLLLSSRLHAARLLVCRRHWMSFTGKTARCFPFHGSSICHLHFVSLLHTRVPVFCSLPDIGRLGQRLTSPQAELVAYSKAVPWLCDCYAGAMKATRLCCCLSSGTCWPLMQGGFNPADRPNKAPILWSTLKAL